MNWTVSLAERSIDPKRVQLALDAIAKEWPPDFLPLQETIEKFPLGEEALLHLFAVSPITVERICRDPEALVWLSDPDVCNADRGPRRMQVEVDRWKEEGFDSRFRALRKAKGREMIRIALREVAGLSSLGQTTMELSVLAEICLKNVYEGWYQELTRRWGAPKTDFAILGMGKLGGQELNYSSDIDVIFVYGEEGFLNPSFSYHEFFTRLCEKIVATFSNAESGGSLFRIDLRLRPEGGSGPLVRSLESMENYYAGFGETWERMALIKARGVCGSQELAYEFCQYLQPFIYPRTLSPDILDEIYAIKRRIDREVVGHEKMHRNVKLGYGGIREIEFIVQTFQMLHGARHAFLHDRSTLRTLKSLLQLEMMPSDDASVLDEAYRFLRTVEHRLQIENEQQTHSLPDKTEDQERLARTLGFPDWQHFSKELTGHTGKVHQIFERVLGAGNSKPPEETDLGFFNDQQQASKILKELESGNVATHVSPRTKKLYRKLEPYLLQELQDTGDPDLALTRFVRFVERYGIRGLLFESLVANPKLLELLIQLFDNSRFGTDIVLRRPQFIEEITRSGQLNSVMKLEDYLAGLERNEEKLAWAEWVRVYRRGQILRILLRDILGLASPIVVQAEYSALAEACVLFVIKQLGVGEDLTIIAMGKFGGGELSYGCDLDVVFVGGNIPAAEKLIKAMTHSTAEGIVFPMDARLRPEGNSGLLTVPLSAYQNYFEGRAQMWEAQALTKARPIFGKDASAFLDSAKETWQRFGQRPDLFHTIRAMHEKIVRQRGGEDQELDFKTGVGGLMEVEFFVQGFQMKHAFWEPNTLRALDLLRPIIPGETVDLLQENYTFLRKCEAVVRRVDNSGGSTLPRQPAEERKIATRMGFENLEEFLSRYQKVKEGNHSIFTQYFHST